jgi:hypothetical protein
VLEFSPYITNIDRLDGVQEQSWCCRVLTR